MAERHAQPVPALEVRVRIDRSARAHLALDASFSAPAGVTILFGPSGAGKSTLLAAIAGLSRPDAGRIALAGRALFDSVAQVDVPAHQRGVSMVFQSLALFPHLTALGNVEYGIDRAVARAARRERALATLARMKVEHLAHRRPRSFSGGEAQRVALARAFARVPAVVLLDEAFSALDRRLRTALHEEVAALVAELRVPALQVTHDPDEARAMGERCVRLEAGRVVAEGSVAEVLGA